MISSRANTAHARARALAHAPICPVVEPVKGPSARGAAACGVRRERGRGLGRARARARAGAGTGERGREILNRTQPVPRRT